MHSYALLFSLKTHWTRTTIITERCKCHHVTCCANNKRYCCVLKHLYGKTPAFNKKKNDCSIVTVKKITSSNHIILHEWNMRKCVLQNCTGTSDMSSPEQALTPHMIQAPDMSTKLENIRGPKKKSLNLWQHQVFRHHTVIIWENKNLMLYIFDLFQGAIRRQLT